MSPVARFVTAGVAALSFLPAALHAQRLMELEGIQLRGSARVVAYGAATCEIREGFAGDDKAWDPANRGQPLDVWQLDFSVYNGSGKWLDHLIARYNIESEWPPCSSWDGPRAGAVEGPVEWGNAAGFIQESGRNVVEPGQTLTTTTYLVVFHSDEPPRFERWSMDYDFATSPPVAGTRTPSPSPRPERPQAFAAQNVSTGPAPGCLTTTDGYCYRELENQPGCYAWYAFRGSSSVTMAWTGGCADGLANGAGDLIIRLVDEDGEARILTTTGLLGNGKHTGRWIQQHPDGSVDEGPFVAGKRNGRWIRRGADGEVREGPVVDDKSNGQWTIRHPGGRVEEGPYVDGKKHGHWKERDPDGGLSQGPYVDDKKHGRWTFRNDSEDTLAVSGEGLYVEGERHGLWTGRMPDGSPVAECYSHGEWEWGPSSADSRPCP